METLSPEWGYKMKDYIVNSKKSPCKQKKWYDSRPCCSLEFVNFEFILQVIVLIDELGLNSVEYN